MGKSTLTESDFERAALELLCEVPAIQAVAEVESAQSGFLPDGRPVILFERHKFYQFTKGAHYLTHPSICNQERGGYLGKEREWQRYDQAQELNANAAALATSWGKFQIMGFNYEACGYASVGEFVAAMCESEAKQLDAFVNFIKSRGLDDDLRERNWATFARVYNGPKYRENHYDEKLQAAYQKYSRLRPATKDLRRRVEPLTAESLEELPPARIGSTHDTVSTPADPPIQATQNGRRAFLVTVLGWLSGVPGSVWAILRGDPQTARLIIVCVAVLTLAWLARGTSLDRMRIRSAEHPGRYTAK